MRLCVLNCIVRHYTRTWLLKHQVKIEDAGFDWKILGPDVQENDYVAFTCDQDAYSYRYSTKAPMDGIDGRGVYVSVCFATSPHKAAGLKNDVIQLFERSAISSDSWQQGKITYTWGKRDTPPKTRNQGDRKGKREKRGKRGEIGEEKERRQKRKKKKEQEGKNKAVDKNKGDMIRWILTVRANNCEHGVDVSYFRTKAVLRNQTCVFVLYTIRSSLFYNVSKKIGITLRDLWRQHSWLYVSSRSFSWYIGRHLIVCHDP